MSNEDEANRLIELAKQWRANRGEEIELPSGKRARVLRNINLVAIIKTGQIPNPLASVLESMIVDGKNSLDDEARSNPEVLVQYTDMVNKVVAQAFVEPRCEFPPEGENPATWQPEDPGAISISDVDISDRSYIYFVATGGATDLETFREQQKQLMASVADGKVIQETSKRASVSAKRGTKSTTRVRS